MKDKDKSRKDREAMDKVRKAANAAFTQKVLFSQSSDRKRWDDLWRRVRLVCTVCEEGYLVPRTRTRMSPQCIVCSATPLAMNAFFPTKATIVLTLFDGMFHGELAPYIMVEPKPLRESA